MRFLFSIFSALLILSVNTFSQYTNYVLFPSANVQIEPIITKNPSNPLVLFASAYTVVGGQTSEGIYVTTNGGLNWNGTDQNPGAPIGNHGGDPGPMIDKNGTFIITHLGNGSPGMFSNFSTDQGASWSGNALIASNNQEKGSPGTDVDPASPYYGRSYIAWSLPTTPFRIILSYTTNSGTSWSSVININNSVTNHQSLGAVVSFGSAGNVYIAWASATQNSPFNEDAIGFGVSTNGGTSWTVQEQAFSVNGIKTNQLQPWLIRCNGYPFMDVDNNSGPRNGWIYIVSAEVNHSPAGSDPDVVFHRSTNGGTTWSQGIRVNQDILNNGKIQFFPVIAVDNSGAINVVYYDSRNHTLPADSSVDVFLSRSTNGGDNWSDYKISDHSFVPHAATGFGGSSIMGDHIGLTHVNGKLYPVWMDNFNSAPGMLKIWSTIIDVNAIGIQKIGTEIPNGFSLQQNYPNPFNPSTKIRFDVPHSAIGHTLKLTVYDNTGKEIAVLVNSQLQEGTYETDFDALKYASGVYYYRLSTDNYSQTKKMVLLK